MINQTYNRQEWKNALRNHYQNYKDFNDPISSTDLTCAPFRIITCPNFVSQEKIDLLVDEVKAQEFKHKSNDLYEFYQSNELKFNKNGVIAELASSLSSAEWISTLSAITGTQLSGDLDMAAQEYRQGGYLLCHDDDMGQDEDARLIAFILYLCDPEWKEEDGGQLQLYDSDENGSPGQVVRSILPKRNTFAFFSLSKTSYHHVQQVFSSRFNRYSITGWFRGTRKTIPQILQLETLINPTINFADWINPLYYNSSNIKMLKDAFSDQSYLVLRDFIKTDLFTSLLNSSSNLEFCKVGPANIQSLSKLVKCNQLWTQFLGWFQSKEFKSWIESISGLYLTTFTSLDARKFSLGDYTLVHDRVVDPLGLDVFVSFPVFKTTDTEWNESWGGQLHYIYDKDSIFTHTPQQNELVLVYRNDSDIHKFVKHVSHSSLGDRLEICGIYLEK